MTSRGRPYQASHHNIRPLCQYLDCRDARIKNSKYCLPHDMLYGHGHENKAEDQIIQSGIRQISKEELMSGRAFTRRRHLIHLEEKV